jgi:hypothetical protein
MEVLLAVAAALCKSVRKLLNYHMALSLDAVCKGSLFSWTGGPDGVVAWRIAGTLNPL